MNIYDFKVRNSKGVEVPMTEYEGKVLLIVNTATGCGFTPKYEGLQNLYDKYKGTQACNMAGSDHHLKTGGNWMRSPIPARFHYHPQ